MKPRADEPARTDALPDLAAFGLDSSGDEWLDLIRRARRTRGLGPLCGYELLEEVSRGAQGIVYRAREEGRDRVVAVKRLLAGSFATDAARARFERETQTVSRLQHPNIVRLHGVELAGRQPLLVMEWIEGAAIDRWADHVRAGAAPVGAVLAAFLKVCDAVHHAHQRGVIHRDLKPSNVLVDAAGEPHLLDFGLVKLTSEESRGAATLTCSSDFLGTPAYAAPEQVRGDHDAVDVRTDVYALGVILFRVLTGHLPFEQAGNLADLLSAIQHLDSARPSHLNGALNDDIDAIVAKAMAKEIENRYASVDALAADLRRYLAGDPIEAQRGRRWYVLRKMIRRHRTAFGVAALFVVLIVGATAVLGAMYARQTQLLAQVTSAKEAESRSRQAAQQQQQVLEKLLSAAAAIGQGTDLAVRRGWLDEATSLIESQLAGQGHAQAAAHDAIGRTYQSLALYPEAELHLRQALELRRREYTGDHPDLAVSISHLGQLLLDYNRPAEAEAPLREALAMRLRLFDGDHLDIAASLNSVGTVALCRGAYLAAESMQREALAMYRRLYGDNHEDVAHTLNWLGQTYLRRSEFAVAELLYREALGTYRALYGDENREVAGIKINLSKALFYQGDYDAAEPILREAIDTSRRLLGDWHDNVAWGLHRLGLLLDARGEVAEAEAALLESLAIYRRCFGDGDPYVTMVMDSLDKLGRTR